jgi:hypothetical protein
MLTWDDQRGALGTACLTLMTASQGNLNVPGVARASDSASGSTVPP